MERFYDQVQPLLPLAMASPTSGSRTALKVEPSGKMVSSWDPRWKTTICVGLVILLALILLLGYSILPQHLPAFLISSPELDTTDLHYAVVIDAGSSGSRAYLYAWPTHSGNPHELLNISPLTGMDGNPIYKKVTPGLSSLKERPYEAMGYLWPLLEFAQSHIPAEKIKETPLYILATAGMRLLASTEQEAILKHVRDGVHSKFGFLFPEGNLEIISGKQEGIYQWLAINYVLGKFRHAHGSDVVALASPLKESDGFEDNLVLRPRTVGAIDMGGASMQIAMEITSPLQLQGLSEPEKSQVVEINLGCKDHDKEHTYRVFVTTFLGYGANEALARHRRNLILSQITANDSTITGLKPKERVKDPCLPFNFEESVRLNLDESLYSIPFNLSRELGSSTMVFLVGTGNWDQCQESLKDFAQQRESYSKCEDKSCPDAGIKIPAIQFENSEFFAFSEFWYSMEDVLRMGGPYIHSKFERAARHYCETPWELTWNRFKAGQFRKADRQRLETQCFKSNWLTVALHAGFGFPQGYTHLSAAPETVNGKVVHWTLGALLYRTRFLPLSWKLPSRLESILIHLEDLFSHSDPKPFSFSPDPTLLTSFSILTFLAQEEPSGDKEKKTAKYHPDQQTVTRPDWKLQFILRDNLKLDTQPLVYQLSPAPWEIEARVQDRVHHGTYHSAFASGYLYSHYIVFLCLIFVILSIFVYLDGLKSFFKPSTFRRGTSRPFWSSSPNSASEMDLEAKYLASRMEPDDELLLVSTSGTMKHVNSKSGLFIN